MMEGLYTNSFGMRLLDTSSAHDWNLLHRQLLKCKDVFYRYADGSTYKVTIHKDYHDDIVDGLGSQLKFWEVVTCLGRKHIKINNQPSYAMARTRLNLEKVEEGVLENA